MSKMLLTSRGKFSERCAEGKARNGLDELRSSLAVARSATGLGKTAYLAVHRDARLVELYLPGVAPKQSEKRGDCEGCSEDSRRRLMAKLHTIRRDAPLPTMITLTFPEEVNITVAEAKVCRRAFMKRIQRRHAEICAIWRVEAHPEMSLRLGRVHPHFHMLTWNAWFDLEWLSWQWTRTVWSVLDLDPCLMDDAGRVVAEKHLKAAVNTERVRKWEGVTYCAKQYIAKEEEYPIGKAGRVWGWDNGALLPCSAVEKIELTNAQAAAVISRARKWMDAKGIVSERDTVLRSYYVEDPDLFLQLLMHQPGIRQQCFTSDKQSGIRARDLARKL